MSKAMRSGMVSTASEPTGISPLYQGLNLLLERREFVGTTGRPGLRARFGPAALAGFRDLFAAPFSLAAVLPSTVSLRNSLRHGDESPSP